MKFPRKVGYPWKRNVFSMEEYNALINKMTGTVDKLYTSVYKYNKEGVMDKVLLDIIPFDIDWDNSFDSMMELHNKLMEDDIKHQIMFSTGGFWVFVFTNAIEKKEKQHAKLILKNAQLDIIKDTDLYFGNSKIAPLDISILGDVERLTRTPFSFDKRRDSYVIFLGPNDLINMNHIKQTSKYCDEIRRHQIYIFGNKFYDIEKIECKYIEDRNVEINEMSTFTLDENIDEKTKLILKLLPDCVQAWITNQEMATWEARAYATLYLREKGFSKKQAEDLLKQFYIKHYRTDKWENNWKHYMEAAQCSEHMYKRQDLKFLNCGKIHNLGLCTGKCSHYKGSEKSPAYR